MCKCVNLQQRFLNLSNKKRRISSRKNEISVGRFTQMPHIFLNCSSVQQLQIITFSFMHLSGTGHLCVYRFIIQNLMNTIRWVFAEVHVSFHFVNVRFLGKDVCFPIKFYKKMFNKTGKLQVFVLYLSKCLCFEYRQYKIPPKQCSENINPAMN